VIALVDYGAGNLASVRKALAALGAEFTTARSAAEVGTARGVIVPGVGHFDATRALDEGWRDAIRTAVQNGTPLFGICLGMQWLFEGSDEAPGLPGLGLFAGTCVHLAGASTQESKIGPAPFNSAARSKLDPTPFHSAAPSKLDPTPFKVPHVGWNTLELPRPSGLMAGVAPGAQVYFTHSYMAPVGPEAAAITCYGRRFAAAVQDGAIAGVQFHPEKSSDVGLRILGNWLAMCR